MYKIVVFYKYFHFNFLYQNMSKIFFIVKNEGERKWEIPGICKTTHNIYSHSFLLKFQRNALSQI